MLKLNFTLFFNDDGGINFNVIPQLILRCKKKINYVRTNLGHYEKKIHYININNTLDQGTLGY